MDKNGRRGQFVGFYGIVVLVDSPPSLPFQAGTHVAALNLNYEMYSSLLV